MYENKRGPDHQRKRNTSKERKYIRVTENYVPDSCVSWFSWLCPTHNKQHGLAASTYSALYGFLISVATNASFMDFLTQKARRKWLLDFFIYFKMLWEIRVLVHEYITLLAAARSLISGNWLRCSRFFSG